MHTTDLSRWQHAHVLLGAAHRKNECRAWAVIALTATMMVVELAAGSLYGSMALIADGWHMATHVGALGITALAYAYARRHASDPAFSFGTGHFGAIVSIASDRPRPAAEIKALLAHRCELAHLTLEVNACAAHAA